MSILLFDVSSALKNPGKEYGVEREVQLDSIESFGDQIAFEPALLQVTIVSDGNQLDIKGQTSARIHTRCALCLQPASATVVAPVLQRYARRPVEDDASDVEVHPLENSQVDLAETAREALLLALPMRFYCKEDCKGLCPVCGADSNVDSCDCMEQREQEAEREKEQSNPFSVLKQLLTEDEEV